MEYYVDKTDVIYLQGGRSINSTWIQWLVV